MRISRARRWNYHTLGVRSGYSQADVTNFAKVLTGWTWLRPEEPVHGGEFVFVRRFHEPGDQVVLGKRYTEGGLDQATPCLPIWRAIRRRRRLLAKSSLGILSLTTRRRRLWTNWPRPFSTPMAT
jgi:hypothetical protein